MKKMTKKDGKAFLRRWRAVNRFQEEELRRKTMRERYDDLLALFNAWPLFIASRRVKKSTDVYKRWAKLKRLMCHD